MSKPQELQDGTNDFADRPVPPSARRSAIDVLVVWIGFIIVVGTMTAGAGLATQARLPTILEGIVIGNVVLGLFAAFAGYIGAKSGLTFYQLGEQVFGEASMRIVGLYVPVILIGWFAIESAILGGFLGKIAGLGETEQRVCMVISAMVMATSAYFGFRALKNLSLVLLPLIFALGGFAILNTQLEGLEGRQTLPPTPQGVDYVVAIVVSTWIVGVLTNLPDVTRFARTPLAGAAIGFFGILVGNVFNLLIGALAAINTGQADPAQILVGLGFVPLAVILAVANIWTTNDNNLYSATLNASRVLRVSRGTATIICAAIGTIVAAFNPATIDSIFTVLILMGTTAPALGGVVLGGYVAREWVRAETAVPIFAWVGWAAGTAAAYYLQSIQGIFAGFFIGFVTAMIAYLVATPGKAPAS